MSLSNKILLRFPGDEATYALLSGHGSFG